MEKKYKRYALAVRCICAMLLSFALTYELCAVLSLSVPFYYIVIAIITVQAAVLAVDALKGRLVFWICIGAIALTAIAVPALLGGNAKESVKDAMNWVNGTVPWLREYVGSLETGLPQEPDFYRSLFISGVCIIASMAVFYPLCKYYPTRLALGLIILAALIVIAVKGYDLGKITLGIALVYLAFCFVEICNRQLDRRRSDKKPYASLFLFPVCLIIAAVSVLLPAKEEPIQWTAVKKMMEKVSVSTDSITDRFAILFKKVPDDFTIEFNEINFSGDKATLDARNRETIVDVMPTTDSRSAIYLRGSVKSDYTGTGWLDRSAEFLEQDAAMEPYEVMYSLRRTGLRTDVDEDIYHKLTINVKYGDIITRSLLHSSLYMQTQYDGKGLFNLEGSNIRFVKFKRTGCVYDHVFYETNWGSENLKNHLRSLDGFDYDTDTTDFDSLLSPQYSAYQEIGGSFIGIDKNIFCDGIAKRLADRADVIDSLYGSLPGSVPARVYELADEICDGCETKYDKIAAVENYFQQNGYTYTRYPDRMPEGEDFTDWMLFEEKGGYCTYYATAAAVLLRCEGIPTRYVEGVRIDKDLGGAVIYHANGDEAHAWCEAYIEGYGWVTLDPTPGYGIGTSPEWTRRKINYSTVPVETQDAPIDVPQPEQQAEQTETGDAVDPALLAMLEAERLAKRRLMWTIVSILLAALLVLGAIIAFVSYKNAKRKRYRRASDNEKIVMLMRDILMYIGTADRKMEESETVLEFTESTGERYDLFEMKLHDAVMLYLRVRYSSAEATHMDVLSLFRYRRELRRSVVRTSGPMARIKFQLSETI